MSLEIEKKMILAVLRDRLSKNCLGDAEREKLSKACKMIETRDYQTIDRKGIENLKRYFGIYYPVKIEK